ncbi:MAG: hypothetical protein JNK72_25635 [Myxococcales bacterium]|nr:hypothetical protein [Myxococcales bacterium]
MSETAEGVSSRPAVRRVMLAVFVMALAVYAAFAGDRLRVHSPDNHFSYLADAYLHGTLSVRCDVGVAQGEVCPPGGGGNDWARFNDRWFVAFPSLPAVIYMPAVALFGRNFPNRVLDVLLAALAPALLYGLLEALVKRGHSTRPWRENLALTALFAFGTVFFYCAVQGSVWFVAHIVAASLGVAYVWHALDARSPLLAGLFLGLSFHTRTSTLFGAVFFGLEALRVHRLAGAASDDARPSEGGLLRWLRGVDWPRALRSIVRFSLPVLLALGVYLLLNKLRFGDAGEVGYRYLQIRWQARIARWGLFNYHYLSRNLGVVLALLPWVTRTAPFIQISRHGLALWVTTPQYLELLRPARRHALGWSAGIAALVIASVDLLYQNSGWVQFGYRFSNDYAVFLVLLLAVMGRPFRRWQWALLALAIAVNTFGAATFDRPNEVYQGDNDAHGMFQPD